MTKGIRPWNGGEDTRLFQVLVGPEVPGREPQMLVPKNECGETLNKGELAYNGAP